MNLRALVGTLLIASAVATPAFAAAPADATKPQADGTESTTQAASNLKAHIQAAKDLLKKIEGLKAKGKAASAAEVAKARASLGKFKTMLAEAKAEGHAARAMVLAKIVNKMQADLDQIDPMGDKPAKNTTPAGAKK